MQCSTDTCLNAAGKICHAPSPRRFHEVVIFSSMHVQILASCDWPRDPLFRRVLNLLIRRLYIWPLSFFILFYFHGDPYRDSSQGNLLWEPWIKPHMHPDLSPSHPFVPALSIGLSQRRLIPSDISMGERKEACIEGIPFNHVEGCGRCLQTLTIDSTMKILCCFRVAD